MYNNINTFTVYYIWSQGKLLHVHLVIEPHYTGDKIYAHKSQSMMDLGTCAYRTHCWPAR